MSSQGRFANYATIDLAAQCRMQARDNLDPEYSQFMDAVAARLIRCGIISPDGDEEEMQRLLAQAYTQGATDVHEEWKRNPTDCPRGDPDFSESASDYARQENERWHTIQPLSHGDLAADAADYQRAFADGIEAAANVASSIADEHKKWSDNAAEWSTIVGQGWAIRSEECLNIAAAIRKIRAK